jgi:hypothetical protein
MVPNPNRATPDFKAVLGQMPGSAITCPYCQGAVEYQEDGETLAISGKGAAALLASKNGNASHRLRKSNEPTSRSRDDARTMDCGGEADARCAAWVCLRGGCDAMKLTPSELEFLAAWAREEWEPACYSLPAHRLQLAHGVRAGSLTVLIKAWVEVERKRDYEILDVAMNSEPTWPWPTQEQFQSRLKKASTLWDQEAPVA